MPIYEYECPSCGCFEHSQSIHDRALERCPKCRRKVQRLISATSFQLKGGGWYSDGYHRSDSPKDAGGESKTGTESKASEPNSSDSKTQGAEAGVSKKSDSKPGQVAAGSSKAKPKKAKPSATTTRD